ncbi:MAG: PAS domain-containing protein [Arenibacterium sp.]
MDKSNLDLGNVSSSKVISLSRFTSGQSLSPIRQAEAYWSALRQGDSIPRRSDVDPRGLENLLHCAFVLESVAPGIARFRIAGRHIVDVSGMEVRGMPITAMFSARARQDMSDALTEMFNTPSIVELTLTSQPSAGRRLFEAHMALLPLKDEQDKVTRALGVLVAEDNRDPKPARFEVTGLSSRRVGGLQYGDVARAPEQPAKTPGFADSETRFETGVSYLRLVKTDE